jgi:hypothetical protein
MAEERRSHPRIPAEPPLRLLDERGREETFDLVDLSECGARIRCKQGMAAMTRIRVAVILPGARLGRKGEVRLDTMGVVVWSHPSGDGRYDTGVFFPELEPGQRDLLGSYVRSW